MQNFNNQHEEQYYYNNLTNSGQGNLPGQMPNNTVNQPTIIRPEIPAPTVEQATTFEKPKPSSPQQRSLRPQQTPTRQVQNPTRQNPVRTQPVTQTKDEQIKQIFEEIDEVKKQIKRPGALTRIEKLLRQILDLSS